MAYFHKDFKKKLLQIKEILTDKKDLKYLHKKKRSSRIKKILSQILTNRNECVQINSR